MNATAAPSAFAFASNDDAFCDYLEVGAIEATTTSTPNNNNNAADAAATAAFGEPINVVVRREAGQAWGFALDFPRMSVAELASVAAEERIAAMELVKRGEATVNEALHRVKEAAWTKQGGSAAGKGSGSAPRPGQCAIAISEVFWNSAAARSGVCEGDCIVAVDGAAVAGRSVESVMGQLKANNATQVVLAVQPLIHSRPGPALAAAASATATASAGGADLYADGQAYADVQVTRAGGEMWGLGIMTTPNGYVIIRVEPSGNAHAAGLRSGDRILAINGDAFATASGVGPLTKQMKGAGCGMAVRVVPREQWVRVVHEAGTAA